MTSPIFLHESAKALPIKNGDSFKRLCCTKN